VLAAMPLWDEIPVIDPRLDARARAWLPAEATDVIVSPDSASAVLRIGYAQMADLYLMDLSTGNLRALTTDRGGNIFPFFSSDGRWLAYVSHRDVNMEVYVMPATGGPSVRITRDSDWRNIITWNTDGTLTVDTRGDENWTYIFDPIAGAVDRWPARTTP
jgi:Tol biopolymer transport system component